MKLPHVVSLLLIPFLPSLHAAAPSAPTKARLVDYYEQLGIDTTAPRFGWVVNDSDRGESQTAYQILVANSAGELAGDQGALWNSGKVASAQQFGVVYAGSALAKTRRYFWKVRTWDKDGQVSPWSEARDFVTGFFQTSDWNAGAQWIRRSQATDRSTDVPVMFRKTFSVSKTVKQAFLYATGLGQFVASLNGGKVGNHEIDPAWTDYDKAMNYVTFDVTSQIAQGSNVLGMMLGSGWLNATDNLGVRPFGVERMLAQLHVDYTDGTSEDVVSDPTWKVTTSPFTYTEMHGVEYYDARLDQAGWKSPGFNDSAWAYAVPATAPAGVLSAQSSPPVVVPQVFQGVNIASPSANNYVFDFGQNMQAQFEIKVSGTAGAKITLTPGEYRNGDGTVNPGRCATMTYTLKGGGIETWRQTFSTVGMRYVQVGGVSTNSGQTALPFIQGVTGYYTYTASDNVGSFVSSDTRYNKIRDLAVNAFRSNLTSLHTDGPNLEKLGWQEVVWTTLSSTVYQHDLLNLFSKIMKDVREGQRNTGLCSTIAPNYFYTTTTPSQGMYDDAPAWGSSIFNASWELYKTYGDKKVLSDSYSAMTRYLAYLKAKEANSLITYEGLGDWMAPGGRSVQNIEGAIYVLDTRLMRDIATALGKTDDATFYGNEFTRVRNAYNAAYFNSATGKYSPVSQGNLAMPLAWGIVPAGREQDVANALIKDIAQPAEATAQGGEVGNVVPGHATTGDIGTTFLWRVLGDAGQHDLVESMIMQPNPPSYLSMINAGETAMAENWNVGNIRSHNHDMLGGIFEWLYRTPGGISSLEPGYAKVQLKPGMPSGMGSVTASYDSVRGLVGSAWSVSGNQITWNVQVPVNATARICIPTRGTPLSSLTIQESGTPIYSNGAASGSVTGLAYDSVEGTGSATFVVWNAGSGSYQFTWQFIPGPTNVALVTGDQQIALTWTAASGANSYQVKRSTTPGGPYTLIASNVTSPSFTDTTVANGVNYYYVVAAVSSQGNSADSAEVSGIPGSGLGFETPVISNPNYRYSPTGSPWTFSTQSGSNGSGISGNNSAFTSSNPVAPEGTQVAFLQGTGSFSKSFRTTPGVTCTVTFSAAQRGGGSNKGGGQTWDLRKDGTTIASFAPPQSATSYATYTASFAATATAHTLAFVGTNTRGNDNTIFLDDVRLTAPVPGTPAGLTASGGNGAISLNWSAVSSADTYNVKRANNTGGPYTMVASGLTTPTYTNSGLGDGVGRFYVISATNVGGESGNSSEASATTYTAMEKWRLANFGSIAASGNAADNADPDGDGATNAQEFAAGTNPNRGDSVFKITQLTSDENGWWISFPAVLGKTYRLESSPDLKPNSWTMIQDVTATADGIIQIQDPDKTEMKQFYRARILP